MDLLGWSIIEVLSGTGLHIVMLGLLFGFIEGLSKDTMKRVVLVIVVVGVVILGVVSVLRKGAPCPVAAPSPVMPPPPVVVTNAPAVSNVAPVSVVPPLAATPAEKLPKGWGVPEGSDLKY